MLVHWVPKMISFRCVDKGQAIWLRVENDLLLWLVIVYVQGCGLNFFHFIFLFFSYSKCTVLKKAYILTAKYYFFCPHYKQPPQLSESVQWTSKHKFPMQEKAWYSYSAEHYLTCWLAYEDALDIDGLDEMAEQGALVAQHLPLGNLVCGGHAHHLGSRVLKGWWENWEHLEKKQINMW